MIEYIIPKSYQFRTPSDVVIYDTLEVVDDYDSDDSEDDVDSSYRRNGCECESTMNRIVLDTFVAIQMITSILQHHL